MHGLTWAEAQGPPEFRSLPCSGWSILPGLRCHCKQTYPTHKFAMMSHTHKLLQGRGELSCYMRCAVEKCRPGKIKSLAAFHKEGRHLRIVTCNTCKRDLCAKGGNTTNMSKHLATQHGIILQQCRVFDALSSTSASTSTAGKIKQLANVILLIWVLFICLLFTGLHCCPEVTKERPEMQVYQSGEEDFQQRLNRPTRTYMSFCCHWFDSGIQKTGHTVFKLCIV